MIELTKKYRIIWDLYTLNIQDDHTKDYTGSVTKIINSNLEYYESDNLQDILDKIDTEYLNILGEHVDYNENI